MTALLPSQIVSVWERGAGCSPLQQALYILDACDSGYSMDSILDMPIGTRDTLLIQLREATIGPRFECVLVCPSCGERLEFAFYGSDVISQPKAHTDGAHNWSGDGYSVSYRPVTSRDLLAVSKTGDRSAIGHQLICQCILSVQRFDTNIDIDALPAGILDAVIRDMSNADPNADIQLKAVCPACSYEWESAFDIAAYFWREIETQSKQLLRDVHALALAYGWREMDILTMSAWKRHHYIQLIAP